jgi:hypothetical protein
MNLHTTISLPLVVVGKANKNRFKDGPFFFFFLLSKNAPSMYLLFWHDLQAPPDLAPQWTWSLAWMEWITEESSYV